jgi:hypothetical protein
MHQVRSSRFGLSCAVERKASLDMARHEDKALFYAE